MSDIHILRFILSDIHHTIYYVISHYTITVYTRVSVPWPQLVSLAPGSPFRMKLWLPPTAIIMTDIIHAYKITIIH